MKMPQKYDAGKRIRTSEGTKPRDLESRPFDRSGIPARGDEYLSRFKALGNLLLASIVRA